MMLNIFLCAYLPPTYLYGWNICSALFPVFYVVCFLSYWQYFVCFRYKSFTKYVIYKYFPQHCGLTSHSFKLSFESRSSWFLWTPIDQFFETSCFWCCIKEIFAQLKITKISSDVFSQKLYSFRSYTEVYGPFWVTVCLWCASPQLSTQRCTQSLSHLLQSS